MVLSDAADLLQRVAEHILQDDAAALRHRQAHECVQAGCCCLTLMNFVNRIGDHGHILVANEPLLPGTAA
jgi:hypothetical protein